MKIYYKLVLILYIIIIYPEVVKNLFGFFSDSSQSSSLQFSVFSANGSPPFFFEINKNSLPD